MAFKKLKIRFANTVGELMRFWGFKEAYGRIWGYLYLGGEPKSARELSQDLQINRGALSLQLKELEAWEVIKRLRLPQKRGVYYEAEKILWKMIRRVFRHREKELLEKTAEELRDIAEALQCLKSQSARQAARRALYLYRLSSLASRFLDLFTVDRPPPQSFRLFLEIQQALIRP